MNVYSELKNESKNISWAELHPIHRFCGIFVLKFKKIIILISYASFCCFFFQKLYNFVSNCLLCSSVIGLDFKIHSLSKKGATFWDQIENYFSCSHLAWQDRDYHMTICERLQKIISHGPARKNEADSDENSRDREFSLSSALFY